MNLPVDEALKAADFALTQLVEFSRADRALLTDAEAATIWDALCIVERIRRERPRPGSG